MNRSLFFLFIKQFILLLLLYGGILDIGRAQSIVEVDERNPVDILHVGESIFVTYSSSSSLAKIHAEEKSLTNVFPMDSGPRGLTYDGEHLWIAHREARGVNRVDPEDGTIIDRIELPSEAIDVTASDSYVWATMEESSRTREKLVKINPDSPAIVQQFELLDGLANRIEFFEDHLWISTKNELLKIKPESTIILNRISIGGDIRGITYDGASVWTTSLVEESVYQVDPHTGRIRRIIDLNFTPGRITDRIQDITYESSIWVAIGFDGDHYVEIDPATGEIGKIVDVQFPATAITATDSNVWTALLNGNVFDPPLESDESESKQNKNPDYEIRNDYQVSGQSEMVLNTTSTPDTTFNRVIFDKKQTNFVRNDLKTAAMSDSDSDLKLTTNLYGSAADTLDIDLWTDAGKSRVYIGKRSDTESLSLANLPPRISSNDTGLEALSRTSILLEFGTEADSMIGNPSTTTYVGDTFSFNLTYHLSEKTSRLFREMGFDTESGTDDFRYYFADKFTSKWKRENKVGVSVTNEDEYGLKVKVSGFTKDLPGALGGISGSNETAQSSDNSNENSAKDSRSPCIIENFQLNRGINNLLREFRDHSLDSSPGRVMTTWYYRMI